MGVLSKSRTVLGSVLVYPDFSKTRTSGVAEGIWMVAWRQVKLAEEDQYG